MAPSLCLSKLDKLKTIVYCQLESFPTGKVSHRLLKHFLTMKRSHRSDIIAQKINNSDEKKYLTSAAAKDINQILLSTLIPDRGQASTSTNHDYSKKIKLHSNFSTCLVNDSMSCSRSVSPPPYSPLTPLMLRNKENKDPKPDNTSAVSNAMSCPISNSPPPYSPPLVPKEKGARNSSIAEDEQALSPLPPMSPETQMLYDTLCETATNIFVDSTDMDQLNSLYKDDPFCENSDDSVKDPDYLVQNSNNEEEDSDLTEVEDSESQIDNSEQEEDIESQIKNKYIKYKKNNNKHTTPTIDKEVEKNTTPTIDKEVENDSTPTIDKSQEKETTPTIDKEVEKDSTPTKDKRQEKETTATIDKEVEKNSTTTKDKRQEKETTPTIDKEVEKDSTPTIDESQEKETTPTIDKEVEKDSTPTIDKRQEKETTPTIDKEVEKNSTTTIDESQDKGITLTIDKEVEKDSTPTINERQEKETTATIDKEVEKDSTPTIDESQEKETTPTIDKEVEKDSTPTINERQEKETTATIDKEVEKDSTPTIDESQEKETTPTIDKEVEKDSTPTIDKRQEKETTPTIDKEVEKNSTTTKDKRQEKETTPTIDKEVEKDSTPTINERQEKETTATIDKEVEKDSTPTIDESQEKETTPTIDKEVEKDSTLTIDESQDKETTPTIEKEVEKDSTPTINERQEKNSTPTIDEEQEINTAATIDEDLDQDTSKGRPIKGRKRKYSYYTLAERKKRKYANLPYQGKNKLIPAKVFEDYLCNCKNQCFLLVSRETRKIEFEKYVKLGSYESQLLYIVNCVKETRKKRSYTCRDSKTGKKKPREYCRTYRLGNIKVCRDMFVRTLQITPQKITVSLKKHRDANANNLKDHRGVAAGGWNKTPQEDTDFVCKVINGLPKYESHYRRAQNGGALYLRPGMNLRQVYDLYVDEHSKEYDGAKTCLSIDTVRRIFYTKFNLKFKGLKKDTCNKCDTISVKLLSSNLTNEVKESLLSEKETHLKSAESLRDQMKKDIEQAKTDTSFECITFDMEKTLPLPRMPTNIIFYKRQLWFYNCGIHVASTNKGYCFVWLEGEAGRGAQEVGSCLIKYVSSYLKPNTKHLTLWSDCCGGQNRNIKVVLLLKVYLACHPTLESITLKFLESGHSFLPNDTDFGKIESHLKHFERLYTANDYINVIKGCTRKNPLKVVKMVKEDFFGTSILEKNIVNRKAFNDKSKVNWLKTKQILLKKENLHSIFMRKSMDDEFGELNIEKKIKGRTFPLNKEQLVSLWPNGKLIAQAKLDDLKSMFHLIPEDCLDFYRSLTGNANIIDDLDGFGRLPDFDMDQDENDLAD